MIQNLIERFKLELNQATDQAEKMRESMGDRSATDVNLATEMNAQIMVCQEKASILSRCIKALQEVGHQQQAEQKRIEPMPIHELRDETEEEHEAFLEAEVRDQKEKEVATKAFVEDEITGVLSELGRERRNVDQLYRYIDWARKSIIGILNVDPRKA